MKHAALAKRASADAGGPTVLALALNKSPSEISQWISGRRPIPSACAARLEKLTTVTRRDLFPEDWHLIWPELAQRGEASPSATPTTQEVSHG